MRVPTTAIYALVALSGLCGLLYEILWIRALGLHFGTSTPAIAMVAATFMGGMAVGNTWFGKRADRASRPFALYARVELALGACGLLISLLLLREGAWLDAIARIAGANETAAFAVRASVLVALLLVPTTLMGGTLPVLTRALLRDERSGAVVGALYAWNTVGAVLGALLPDFFIVPHLGLGATAWIAAMGNVLIAISVTLLAARSPASTTAKPSTHEAAPTPTTATASFDENTSQVALLLAIASGFSGMALEVLWSRTLEHWSAALITSFAVLLATYLAALALGAFFTRSLADRSDQPTRFAGLALSLAGGCSLASIVCAPAWRSFERDLWPRPALRRTGLGFEAIDALLHALYLEALPCLLMGAAFPFIARAVVRADAAGGTTGRLFTVNTLAGVMGSSIAAFVWLPRLGQQDSYLTIAVLLALAGLIGAWPNTSARSRTPWLIVSAWQLCFAIGVSAVLPTDQLARAEFFRIGGHIVATREGATTTAAAAMRFAFGEPYKMELLTPGVSMSDTSQEARRYMGMMAHAAAFTTPTPRRALLICYGVGNTARSLLSHPELQRLDVVDIAREVLALAPQFAHAQHGNPLDDPRTHVFVDDGRHHLLVDDAHARYDIITAEPPPPNHAGVVNLYSREFYRLAKSKLSSHGVITQWLPVFQLAETDVREMIAAFVAELPYTALLYGQTQELILIGSPAPLLIDPARAARSAAQASVARDLHYSGIGALADILGSVLQTDAELRKLAAGSTALCDDRPTIQYPWQPLNDAPDYHALFGDNPARAFALLPRSADAATRVLAARSQRITDASVRFISSAPPADSARFELELGGAVAEALALQPGDESLLVLLGLETDRARAAQQALARPFAAELLRAGRASAEHAGRSNEFEVLSDAALTLARYRLYTNKPSMTLDWLAELTPVADDVALHALLAGAALRELGQMKAAQEKFARAAATTHDASARTRLLALSSGELQPMAAGNPFSP